MTTRFPYGYRTNAAGHAGMADMLTREELERMTTVAKLDPEYWRRVIAMMEDAASVSVPLGVGTGWRVQPNPPPSGFAKPGNSNHEGFPADGTSGQAVAIDHVPEMSWAWMEANCARFGLRTFKDVNGEPWHSQPSDIPAGRNWRTQPWDLPRWNLPGLPQPPEEDEVTDADIAKIVNQVTARLKKELPPAVWVYEIDSTAGDTGDAERARFLLDRTYNTVVAINKKLK